MKLLRSERMSGGTWLFYKTFVTTHCYNTILVINHLHFSPDLHYSLIYFLKTENVSLYALCYIHFINDVLHCHGGKIEHHTRSTMLLKHCINAAITTHFGMLCFIWPQMLFFSFTWDQERKPSCNVFVIAQFLT